jgi:uncharacterized small protein (DUF1192 family)
MTSNIRASNVSQVQIFSDRKANDRLSLCTKHEPELQVVTSQKIQDLVKSRFFQDNFSQFLFSDNSENVNVSIRITDRSIKVCKYGLNGETEHKKASFKNSQNPDDIRSRKSTNFFETAPSKSSEDVDSESSESQSLKSDSPRKSSTNSSHTGIDRKDEPLSSSDDASNATTRSISTKHLLAAAKAQQINRSILDQSNNIFQKCINHQKDNYQSNTDHSLKGRTSHMGKGYSHRNNSSTSDTSYRASHSSRRVDDTANRKYQSSVNLSRRLKLLQQEIERLKKQVDSSNSNLAENLASFETHMSKIEKQLDLPTSNAPQKLEDRIPALERRFSAIEDAIDQLKKITSLSIEKKSLETQIAQLTSYITGLKTHKATKDAEIDDLKNEISAKTAQFNTLQADDSDKAESIKTLTDEIAKKTAQVEGFQL